MASMRPPTCILSCSIVQSTRSQWQSLPARFLLPSFQVRTAKSGTGFNPQKFDKKESKKKKKASTKFKQYDLRDADQFALCDAMRYIRAFEVGRASTSSKYEMAVKLRGLKNGPVIRNRLRLPHPVKTDLRICVICPPDSKYAEAARSAGAVLVGEDEIIDAIKEGRIEFDRCLCTPESLPKLAKSGVARILGPKGLMPSAKTNTVVRDVEEALKGMIGSSEYREKIGVVRMAVGQLGFTPEEMQRNIRAFVDNLKKELNRISDATDKSIAEVVLSSTNSPGFTLSGDFQSADSLQTKELSVL